MAGVSARIVLPWALQDFEATDLYQTLEKTVYDDDGRPVLVPQVDADGKSVSDEDGQPVKVEKRIKVIQVRNHWVMSISRRLFGVTAFGEEVGITRSSWQLTTGPDSTINYMSTAKKWVCTRDKLVPIDPDIGEARQDQTWLYMSKWKTVPDKQFG